MESSGYSQNVACTLCHLLSFQSNCSYFWRCKRSEAEEQTALVVGKLAVERGDNLIRRHQAWGPSLWDPTQSSLGPPSYGPGWVKT